MRISDWSSDVCSSDLRDLRHRLVGDLDVPAVEARADRREQAPRDVPFNVLALPRRRVDRRLHLCLSDGSAAMSADPHAAAHTHDDHHEIEMPHASMRDYVIGFNLSVLLTALPFCLVMPIPLTRGATGPAP